MAARQKRVDNKRKREEDAVQAEAAFLAANPDIAAKKKKEDEMAAKQAERNRRIQGKPWKLIITKPEKVAGTPAELVFECFPPIGFGKSACVKIR